ncbi:MAG: hypothetical protein M3277_12445 [Actinomycetota bacterium]|nr:hypothetical protein [Actinomycetota bacterium]
MEGETLAPEWLGKILQPWLPEDVAGSYVYVPAGDATQDFEACAVVLSRSAITKFQVTRTGRDGVTESVEACSMPLHRVLDVDLYFEAGGWSDETYREIETARLTISFDGKRIWEFPAAVVPTQVNMRKLLAFSRALVRGL